MNYNDPLQTASYLLSEFNYNLPHASKAANLLYIEASRNNDLRKSEFWLKVKKEIARFSVHFYT